MGKISLSTKELRSCFVGNASSLGVFLKGVVGLVIFVEGAYASFPMSFKWCSATAAHQVEGNNVYSDWWKFEKESGNIKNNDQSGLAVNQWNLISEDIKRMKQLGLNSYRFSVEWAKIQPAPDRWDLGALEHYQKVVRQLRESGIEPLVTLHHFTLPQWLAERGGWSSPESIPAFVQFATRVFEALKKDVTIWITFNEPMVLISAGYLDGVFPPKHKGDFSTALSALKNILLAHGKTVASLRSLDSRKGAKFGFAHHLRVFSPENPMSPLDRWMAAQIDQVWNWSFTEALKTGRFQLSIPLQGSIDVKIPELVGSQDFFGLNYYSRDMVGFSFSPPFFKRTTRKNSPVSDLGWEIYPAGLGILLEKIHHRYPSLPILITENGIADAADTRRENFLRSHLHVVETAIMKGIPVQGYCHWSLLDNFEWAEGFGPRFGLFEVDYSTQGRKLRQSALVLKRVISRGTVQ